MKITRRKLAEMIEEAMGMEMVPVEMEMMGHGHSDDHGHGGADALVAVVEHKGTVSKEDCCAAVMSMIECCSCPVTKQALMECCEDIMAGDYD